jgi:hypothetical protein
MVPRRDGAVEVGERLAVIERADFGHEAGDQVEDAVGLGDKGGKRLPPVAAFPAVAALDKCAARAVSLVRLGKEGERQIIDGSRNALRRFEPRAPLLVDQPGRGVGKLACRIAERLAALGLDVQGPPRAKALEHIIRARRGTETSSASVADSRSGPRNASTRLKLPSLLRMTLGATSAAHGR